MKRKCLAVGIILLFVAIAFSPTCSALTSSPQTNTVKASQESSIKNLNYMNDDNASSFDFAIVWGPFEVREDVIPLLALEVRNREPWYNRTINVLGYQSWVPRWVAKKSCWIECYILHIGIVLPHWVFAICFKNVNAW